MSIRAGPGSRKTVASHSSKVSTGLTDLQDMAWDQDEFKDNDSLLGKARQLLHHFEEQLFGLLYLMTKDRKKMFNNRISNTALLTVDFLQFMFFVFSPDFPWYEGFNVLQNLSDTLQLSFEALPKFLFVPFFFFICGAIVTMIGFSIRVAQTSKDQNQNVQMIIVLRLMVSLLITLGYIPFLRIVMVPLDCTFTPDGPVMDIFPSVKCFEGIHTALWIIALLVILSFVPFSLLMSLVYFDSHPKSPNYLSRATNRVDFVYTICRTIVVSVSTFFTRNFYFRVITVLFANITMLVAYLRYPPYHRQQPTCLRISFFATGTISSIIAAITIAIDDEKSYATLILLCIFIFPVAFGSYRWADYYLTSLAKKVTTLHNPNDTTSYEFPNPYMVEFATRAYLRKPSDEDCNSHEIDVVKGIYKRGMQQYPHSAMIRVQYSLFLIAYVPASAITEVRLLVVEMMKMKNIRFDIRFLVFNLRSMWQQDMETRGLGQRGGLDLISYIHFKKNFSIAKHYHREARKALFAFWKSLLRPNVTQAQLELQAEEFERVEQISLNAYENLLSKYFNSQDLLRSYGSFWLDIYRDSNLANICIAIADEIDEYENRKKTQKHQRRIVKEQKQGDIDSGNSDQDKFPSEDDEAKSRIRSEYTTSSSSRSRERIRKMKTHLDRIRKQANAFESKAVRNFSILLFFLQLLLFAIPLAGILIFQQIHLDIMHNEVQISETHLQSFIGSEVLYTSQSIAAISVSNQYKDTSFYNCTSSTSCLARLQDLQDYNVHVMHTFHESHTSTFKLLQRDQDKILDAWLKQYLNMSIFFENTRSKTRLFNILDMNDFLAGHGEEINLDPEPFHDWHSDPRYIFCDTNAYPIITQGYFNVTKAHIIYADNLANEFLWSFVYMAAIGAGFFLLAAIMWSPIYRIVLNEVSSLRFLKLMKKDDVQQMCNMYRYIDRTEDDEDNSLKDDRGHEGTQRSKFRRNISIAAITVVMFGAFIVAFSGIFSALSPVKTTEYAAQRVALTFLTDFLTRSLLVTPGDINPARVELALNVLDSLQDTHDRLVDESSSHDQEVILFDSCPMLPPPGLYQRMAMYLDNRRELILSAASYPKNVRIQMGMDMALSHKEDHFYDCLKHSRNLLQHSAENSLDYAFLTTNVYFWIVWPIFFILTGWTLPVGFRKNVIGASSRSRRMLRMLPREIVQKYRTLGEYMIEKGLIEGISLEDAMSDDEGFEEDSSSDGSNESDSSSKSGKSDSSHSSSSSESGSSGKKKKSKKSKGKQEKEAKNEKTAPQTIEESTNSNPLLAPKNHRHTLAPLEKKPLLPKDSSKKTLTVETKGIGVAFKSFVVSKVLGRQSSMEETSPIARLCVMCQRKPRDVLLSPCGHYLLCSDCAKPLHSCPECKKKISRKEIL
eukprot:TRINITY_DN8232_c0_g1_i1.p1 TRINITY_DN8232_c0_g1~~TRINITY_DN8232_c0_g1_i1.p1  ORF type:complete len:1401 (+),score=263.91 TRINITY_DN8232_c0_g1_i1:46-4248(+)